MAPMEFQRLLDSQLEEGDIKHEIQHLLTRKTAGEELDEEPRNQILNDYLEERIQSHNTHAKTLEQSRQPDATELNALFKDVLHEAWKE